MASAPATQTPAPAQTPAHHFNPIPPAIRRQAENADRLQALSRGEVETDPTAQVEAQADGNSGSNPGSQPEPKSPATPSAPVVPTSTQDDADLTAKLRSTQGRLDAERERTTQLSGQVASLERMVRELQQQQHPQVPETPATPPARLVTQEEENDYGKELLDVVGRRAMDSVQPVLDALRGEVASLKGQLAQVGRTAQAAVTTDLLGELTRRVPTWQTQNTNPEFLAWLALPDPYSGVERQKLLLHAFDGQDVDRVVRFFQGYLDEAAATGAAPQPAPASVPGTPANGRVPLEKFAAPGKASPAASTTPPGSQNKPIYKRSEVTSFYTGKAGGAWRGREAEAAAIEADIFRAQHEGRVTEG